MIIFLMLRGPKLPKLCQHHLLMVSLVLSMRPLRNLPRTLGSKSRMLQMKILLRLYPMLVTLLRLTSSNPPWQTKPRKGKRREKERIRLISRNKIPLNLHLRKVPNTSLHILALSMARITIQKTAQGGLKLVVCWKVPLELLSCSKSLFPRNKLKWWLIHHILFSLWFSGIYGWDDSHPH